MHEAWKDYTLRQVISITPEKAVNCYGSHIQRWGEIQASVAQKINTPTHVCRHIGPSAELQAMRQCTSSPWQALMPHTANSLSNVGSIQAMARNGHIRTDALWRMSMRAGIESNWSEFVTFSGQVFEVHRINPRSAACRFVRISVCIVLTDKKSHTQWASESWASVNAPSIRHWRRRRDTCYWKSQA